MYETPALERRVYLCIMRPMNTTSPQTRAALADEWRARADTYDRDARALRLDGDGGAAAECEAAALDYRVAADDLEASVDA